MPNDGIGGTVEPRYWWADRLAPTLVVRTADTQVAFGDADCQWGLTPDEAEEIAAHLIACAAATRAWNERHA